MRSMTQVNLGISLDHVLSLCEIHDPSLFGHFLTPCIIYIIWDPWPKFILEFSYTMYYIFIIWDPWPKFILAFSYTMYYIYEIHDPNFGIISLDHALFELELCAIVSYFCLFILFLLLLIFNWHLFFFKGEWSTHTHNIYI
jgi:hypothetical protein